MHVFYSVNLGYKMYVCISIYPNPNPRPMYVRLYVRMYVCMHAYVRTAPSWAFIERFKNSQSSVRVVVLGMYIV